jgi:hypothetical protein
MDAKSQGVNEEGQSEESKDGEHGGKKGPPSVEGEDPSTAKLHSTSSIKQKIPYPRLTMKFVIISINRT